MTSLRSVFLAVLALAAGGCAQVPLRDGAKAGPFFTPTNVKATSAQLPANVRRVLLMPISAQGVAISEETLNNLDAVFLAELNATARFEVVRLSRDHLAQITGVRHIDSTAPLPAGFIDRLLNIYNDYAADGIIFVDLTTYSPYPPLGLGVRTKLAHIRDSEILWAADLLFTAANPAVANSARRHALKVAGPSGPADLSHTILQNPSRFAGYAAAATFATLPTRIVPRVSN